MFGNYVESEIYKATEKAKNGKQREQKRKQTLMMLLQNDPEEDTFEMEYDPTDPIPPEVAKKMPPARKFNKKQFADPADLFKRAAAKKQSKPSE